MFILRYNEKLTAERGKLHDYLGMDLDYSTPGKLKISMIKYLGMVLKDFPEDIGGAARTPAGDHLFQVQDEDDPEYSPLPGEQAVAFHHAVAQLLIMAMRALRDIQTDVAFLTT